MHFKNYFLKIYVLVIVMFFTILLAGTWGSRAEAREDLIYASSASVFNSKGGDPISQWT